MFQLAEARGSKSGPYCGSDGAHLGPSPLIELREGAYVVRPEQEIAALLAAAYDPPPDAGSLRSRLQTIAEHLQRGDLGQAMISSVLLGFGELSDPAVARLAEADRAVKFNFNPAELRDRDGEWARDPNIVPAGAGGPARNRPKQNQRDWERQPNADFRNRLAIAEGSADKPDFGYREVNARAGALGRYRIRPDGLRAAGMIDANGHWTGKYGVHSRAQFLAEHAAQGKTLADYLRDTDRQLSANGSFEFVNRQVEGLVAPFTITRAGLPAAAHRSGARATRNYLERLNGSGFRSRELGLTSEERVIETRLRTFADVPYE
jgi:hypothetical protein